MNMYIKNVDYLYNILRAWKQEVLFKSRWDECLHNFEFWRINPTWAKPLFISSLWGYNFGSKHNNKDHVCYDIQHQSRNVERKLEKSEIVVWNVISRLDYGNIASWNLSKRNSPNYIVHMLNFPYMGTWQSQTITTASSYINVLIKLASVVLVYGRVLWLE